jgi:hypothetical protein
MLNSIFGNMLSWIAAALDFILQWVLEMINFNLAFFSANFPIIGELYTALQGVGIGLVIAIAAFQLYKYFMGPLSDAMTNPIEIGVRAMLSIVLIWVGNYMLEGIVNVFSYPYKALLDISQIEGNEGLTIMEKVANSLSSLIVGAPGIVLALIMIIAVGWNTVKLLLEVVERFLMVGILTYTSPLAWPTLTSRNTQSIFQKWFSMFLGQCLLMLLNVWSVKMLISILGYGEANTLLRFIIALAFCKVAQRFDTYLQSLGINAAHTGGALIDDILAVGSTASAIGSKAVGGVVMGSGNKPLGEALTKNGWMGGITYGIGHAYHSSKAAETAANIPSTKMGAESGIFNNAEGGYSWQDKNGNIWSAKDYTGMQGIKAGVQKGYAQYEGESSISKDDKGKYQWTDANGVLHQADSLTGVLAQQQAARALYNNPVSRGYESDILHNPDGTYQWTDRSGNTYTAKDFEAMQNQQAVVRAAYMDKIGQESDIMRKGDGTYQWTDKNGQVWQSNTFADMQATRESIQAGYSIGNSLKNADASAYASKLFNENGTPKAGVTMLDSAGREVLNGGSSYQTANMIANLSTPTAMQTTAGADNISAIKAATIESNDADVAYMLLNTDIPGGIQDERVIGASYEKLFNDDGNNLENGIDTVIPGLSEAFVSSNGEYIAGSGDVEGIHMNSGEMTGNYIPLNEYGNEGEIQGFSIRSTESFNSLSELEKSSYTAFEGANGQKYYASVSKPYISELDILNGSNDRIMRSKQKDFSRNKRKK